MSKFLQILMYSLSKFSTFFANILFIFAKFSFNFCTIKKGFQSHFESEEFQMQSEFILWLLYLLNWSVTYICFLFLFCRSIPGNMHFNTYFCFYNMDISHGCSSLFAIFFFILFFNLISWCQKYQIKYNRKLLCVIHAEV